MTTTLANTETEATKIVCSSCGEGNFAADTTYDDGLHVHRCTNTACEGEGVTLDDIQLDEGETLVTAHGVLAYVTNSDEMTEADAGELVRQGYNLDAFRAWCINTGEAFTYDNRHDFEDAFCGEWDSFAEFAGEQADDLLDAEGLGADSIARRHFDYDGFARDLLLGGDNFTEDAPVSGVYVFRSY